MQLSDLQTYVRDRLSISSSDAAKTTQITTAINQSRYRLNSEFRLLKATASLDTTADTATVALPSDVVEVLSIYSGAALLQPVDEQSFALLDSSGDPQVYVIDGSSATMRVSPTPTETATAALTLAYVQRPTALSNPSDTPSELPAEFHDLIGEDAVYRIAQSEEQFDIAQGAQALVAELKYGPNGLKAFMNRRQGATVSRIALQGFTR